MASTASNRAALSFIIFVVLFAQVLLYPGIDTLVEALGAETRIDASMWFLAAEFSAFILFAGIWGGISDSLGKRIPIIALSAIGASAGYASLVLIPMVVDVSFQSLLALRFVQGSLTIGTFTISITMLMDHPGGHGKNMGTAGIGIGAGTALGAPIGGQLYALGPLVPLLVSSGLFLAVAIVAVLLKDYSPGSHPGGISTVIRNLQHTPTLSIPYAFGYIDRFTAGFFSLVGTLYFREVFQLDPAATGITLALFFAPFAVLQYPFGALSDRIGRTFPIVAGSLCYGVFVIVIGLVETLTFAQIGMVFVGVLGALMAPATMALVTDIANKTERGVAMAGFNVAGSFGFLSGIVIGGQTASYFGYTSAFIIAGSLEIIIAIAALPALVKVTNKLRRAQPE